MSLREYDSLRQPEHHVDHQPTHHRTHELHSHTRFINSRWRNLTHCILELFYYIVSSRVLRTNAHLTFYETTYRVYLLIIIKDIIYNSLERKRTNKLYYNFHL